MSNIVVIVSLKKERYHVLAKYGHSYVTPNSHHNNWLAAPMTMVVLASKYERCINRDDVN